MQRSSLADLKNELRNKKKAMEDAKKSAGGREAKYITQAQYYRAQCRQGMSEQEQRASKRAELLRKFQDDSTTTTTTTSTTSAVAPKSLTQQQEQQQEKEATEGFVAKETEEEGGLENVVFKLPAKEVMRRLRLRNKPITLFGEDDHARAERLKALEESEPMEYDSASGRDNEMHKLLRTMSQKYNVKLIHVCGMKDYDDDDDDDSNSNRKGPKELFDDDDDNNNNSGDLQKQPAAKKKKTEDALLSLKTGTFEDSKDDKPNEKIYKFFKRLLKEWYSLVNSEDEDAEMMKKKSSAGIKELFAFNQCVNAMEPLFRMLMEGGLPEDIFIHISIIVDKLKERKYIEADEEYLRMAIGNAPWPMGVTNVGIHDRVAREKISMNQVARKIIRLFASLHLTLLFFLITDIMNDEVTRKYLQSIKRLATFCQTRYPAYV